MIKKIKFVLSFVVAILVGNTSIAQQDTPATDTMPNNITVYKDYRIDLLGKKMAEYNGAIAFKASRTVKGYRLMVISTSDRDLAMKIRTHLLGNYPDQQVYMTFQNPFIRLRFGDYEDKKDAERVRQELMRSPLISGNVYVVSETIRTKGDKSLLEVPGKK